MQQYLRIRGSDRTDHFLPAQQPPAPLQNQPNQVQQSVAPPPVPNARQVPPQPVAYRQQPQRACFNYDDPSHIEIDCPLNDRERKPIPQQVNSCHTNPSGGWTCPSNPHGIHHGVYPATLPVQGTVAFCINIGRTGHSASEFIAPETTTQEEQVRAA